MKYIVMTDLDGTLLDHKTYDYTPALKAIAQLNQLEIPIILNSSKTQVEIAAIRSQLNNKEPFICENGGIICGLGDLQYLGISRQDFLDKLALIKIKLDLKYQGFADVTVDDVMKWTGLDRDSADKAMQRSATEPLLWQDSDAALAKLRQELEQLNLQCVKGGRFYHVMGIFNKASCFEQLKAHYSQIWQEEVKIIALGDSPNDLPMLEQADHAIVIPSAKGCNVQVDNTSVYYATRSAPYGWQEGITAFFGNQ